MPDDDLAREYLDVEERLGFLRTQLVKNISLALSMQEEANKQLVGATRAARDAGLSWREIGAATGRSHEFFRALLARDAKPKKK